MLKHNLRVALFTRSIRKIYANCIYYIPETDKSLCDMSVQSRVLLLFITANNAFLLPEVRFVQRRK